MTVSAVSDDFSGEIERFEEEAWVDMFQAVPLAMAAQLGLAHERLDACNAFFCRAIPFIHFNSTGSSLGLDAEVSEDVLSELVREYRSRGVSKFWIHHTPHAQPEELPAMLLASGFVVSSGWDRIYRAPAELASPRPTARDFTVRVVDSVTASAWASFIDEAYGLPTSPWLLALVNRPHWRHYALEEGGRIVAVRSVYARGEWAWLGVDAPVPGLMTQDFELDYRLLHAIIADQTKGGVQHIVGDIEVPSDTRDTAAYRDAEALGFTAIYRRVNYQFTFA